MSFLSIMGTRERILWSSVQQLSELSVKIQQHDDNQSYPAIQSLQKSKPCRILTMIQRSEENKGPADQQTRERRGRTPGYRNRHAWIDAQQSESQGYRRRGRSHLLARDTGAGRAKGQLQL